MTADRVDNNQVVAKIAVQNAVEIMDMLLCGEKPQISHVRILPEFILGDTT
jgi:hypothetical protein